jgi:hypothetical protein
MVLNVLHGSDFFLNFGLLNEGCFNEASSYSHEMFDCRWYEAGSVCQLSLVRVPRTYSI